MTRDAAAPQQRRDMLRPAPTIDNTAPDKRITRLLDDQAKEGKQQKRRLSHQPVRTPHQFD